MGLVFVVVGHEAGNCTLVVFGAFQFGIPSMVDLQTLLGHSE